MSSMHAKKGSQYELYYGSLRVSGRGLSFPCSAGGEVDMNILGERARCNYLFARAVVGREFGRPAVRLVNLH